MKSRRLYYFRRRMARTTEERGEEASRAERGAKDPGFASFYCVLVGTSGRRPSGTSYEQYEIRVDDA
jgi:hypothetical protein